MSIKNLQSIIKAREAQHGQPMTEKSQPESNETTEILRLIFAYIKQTMGELNINIAQMNQEINIIKIQQQKILDQHTKDN